jgi:hypothetical protein
MEFEVVVAAIDRQRRSYEGVGAMAARRDEPGAVRRPCSSAVWLVLLVALATTPVWAAESEFEARVAEAPRGDARGYDEVARFIAGLPTQDPELSRLAQRSSWVAYRRFIDEAWKKLESRQLSAMRSWAAAELRPRSPRDEAVLYPFSGPDAINMVTLLGGRDRYLMLSLEPVGEIPDFASLSPAEFDAFFAGLRNSLSSMLKWDFFQTKELRADLTAPGLRGVLPLLLFFSARDGREVRSVRYVDVSPDGTVEEHAAIAGETPVAKWVPGVCIGLTGREAGAGSDLCFYSIDLSSHSLGLRQGFFGFVRERGPFTTSLKAASYLMFKPKYFAIRRFILDHSRRVVQDDSGIPLAAFEERGWEVELLGSYDRPIPLFASRYQDELAAAYRRGDVAPIPFSVGYEIRARKSNLMLATPPAPPLN